MQTNRSCLTSILTSITLILVACLCIFGMFHTETYAAGVDGALSFQLNADGAGYTVSDCTSSSSGALTVPAVYNGLPVTGIGDHVFSYCDNLTSVELPSGVTSIGSYAFFGCRRLTSISFPEGLTRIGADAFAYCKMTSITIPDSVTAIGKCAFRDCRSLTTVILGNGLTSINERIFEGCIDLTTVILGEKVASIDDTAFNYCRSLNFELYDGAQYLGSADNPYMLLYSGSNNTSVIHSDTKVIRQNAFKACGKLTGIDIPNGVTIIGNGAFSGCDRLTSVTLPDSLTHIGGRAFYGCSSLTGIAIPNGVSSMGWYAFWGCSSLTGITLPEGLSSISTSAFERCDSLTSITIPVSVTSIGADAFRKCISLRTVSFKGTKEEWTAITILTGNDALSHATVQFHGIEISCEHSWDDGEITRQPTCTEKGVKTYTCAVCAGIRTESVAETRIHCYGKWTSHDDDRHNHTCSVCGKEETDEHSWDSVVTEPTCTEKGYTTHTCHCGHSYVDSYVAATGHIFANYISDGNATVGSDGTATAQCDHGCGQTDTVTDKASNSATAADSLSSDNTLSVLDIVNVKISPQFSANVTEYTAEVPFEVLKLQIDAKAADGAARVTIDDPELTLNGTSKVTITVTAENGNEKVYTIFAKRATANAPVSNEAEATLPSETIPEETQPTISSTPQSGNEDTGENTSGDRVWVAILIILLCAGLGLVSGVYAIKRRH